MLSIIITHHRTPILLKLCLKSIKESIGQIEHEIFIVDSEAEKETQELIKENFSKIQFVSFEKNVGYAKLVNSGLKKSRGEYILFLNADILVSQNSISRLIEYLEENNQVGIVGPRLLTFNHLPQNSCFRFPTIGGFIARRTFLGKIRWGRERMNRFLMEGEDFSSPRQVDWLQGSAMLTRKDIADKIGLWDERFFLYLEDTDWCRRFWQKGYRVVYLPSAQVFHYYGRASKKWGGFLDALLNKYTWIHLISAFKYFVKWRKDKSYA